MENRPRRPRYAVTVHRVQRLTARMLRVVFGGPELAGFNWNGPAAHIKLILGPDSPDGAIRAPSRTYTPRHFDAAALELTVDFVLHGEGPASTWAAQAQVGQPMRIGGPGRSYGIDAAADWLLIAAMNRRSRRLRRLWKRCPMGCAPRCCSRSTMPLTNTRLQRRDRMSPCVGCTRATAHRSRHRGARRH